MSLSHPVLEKSDIGNSAVDIIRRLLLTCGGSVVNDMTLSGTPPWPDTAFDNLFDETWYAVYGGQSVVIGSGEFLIITGSELLTALRTLDNTITANSVAAVGIEVEYEPKYPLLTGNNYVEGFPKNYGSGQTASSSAIIPTTKLGNKGWLNNLDFFLLDTTDNDHEDTEPLLLRRNNILRFAGGGWAPVVHISAAQAADASLQLFRKNSSGNYVEYCEAGEYDAEEYVENVLRKSYDGSLTGWESTKLYKSDGNGGYEEAHALLPWESTDTKWTIGIGYSQGLYLLDNVEGESGTVWKGLFTDVTEWDGIDLTPYYLAPTAYSPCPVTTITENSLTKTRNLFFLTEGGTNCHGVESMVGSIMFQEPGRTYPRVTDVSAISNMNYARNNNATTTSPVPFAEGGYHTRNVLCTAMELLYSRKNPFRATQFGSGISSVDDCVDNETWHQNGGVRHRQQGSATYLFQKWGETPAFCYNSSGRSDHWSNLMNGRGPKEQCMESQIVASFAEEFGITATTTATSPVMFEVYGGQYYYMNVTDAKTLSEGFMNVRVYKILQDTISVFSSNGSPLTWEVTAILRMSLYGGANISGDIYAYCQGGAECIGNCTVPTTTSTAGNNVDCYLIPDQTKWVRDTTTEKNGGSNFTIENSADALSLGNYTQFNDGYYKARLSYSPMKIADGGDFSSWECAYGYTRNQWETTVGKRARIGLRFRGYATSTYSSPRYWYAIYAASSTYAFFGGSAQARLRKRS